MNLSIFQSSTSCIHIISFFKCIRIILEIQKHIYKTCFCFVNNWANKKDDGYSTLTFMDQQKKTKSVKAKLCIWRSFPVLNGSGCHTFFVDIIDFRRVKNGFIYHRTNVVFILARKAEYLLLGIWILLIFVCCHWARLVLLPQVCFKKRCV